MSNYIVGNATEFFAEQAARQTNFERRLVEQVEKGTTDIEQAKKQIVNLMGQAHRRAKTVTEQHLIQAWEASRELLIHDPAGHDMRKHIEEALNRLSNMA